MMSPSKKYPLAPGEEDALVANSTLSQAMLLLGGVVAAMVVAGLTTGEWRNSIVFFGWADAIAASITALGAGTTVGVGLGLAVAFLLVEQLIELIARRFAGGEEAIIEGRRDLNGELARASWPHILMITCMAGCAEELLFRFGLLGAIQIGFGMVAPAWYASLFALVMASVVFWMAHVRYRDLWSSIAVLIIAFALGLVYIFTGSVAVVAIAHTAYDLASLAIERARMSREDDYFHGPAPDRILLDMLDEQLAESESPDDGDEDEGDDKK